MGFTIRKIVIVIDEERSESGIIADKPLRKVAVAAVIKNPYAGTHREDLNDAIKWGAELGHMLGEKAVRALEDHPESYGKGGIVGIDGEIDHAYMFLTTSMGDAFREAVGEVKLGLHHLEKKDYQVHL